MKRLAVLFVFAMVAVMAQVDRVMAEMNSMKQVLFSPKGFDMDWFCGDKAGRSVVFFREDGKNIVADIRVVDIKDIDINNPIHYGSESCTTEAALTDKGIIFNGCSSASRGIPLAYDPGNRKTPFSGSGVKCNMIELSPR